MKLNSIAKNSSYLGIAVVILTFTSCVDRVVDHEILIRDVTVINAKTGELLPERNVAIDSGFITVIYDSDVALSDSTEVIDGRGKYLIPGLWDMHVHYNWNYMDSNPLLIANGVTGVREMWGYPDLISEILTRSRSGEIDAPEIFTAGAIIDGDPPIWPGSIGVKTTDEARAVVNQQISTGVDFIKVYSRLKEDVFLAIADEAKKRNVPFAGHVPNDVSIYTAIGAGMSSSEHMTGILDASSNALDSVQQLGARYSSDKLNGLIETLDKNRFDSLANILAASDMWLCPTLTVIRAVAYLDDSTFTSDERVAYLPDYMTGSWNPQNDFRFQGNTDDQYVINRKRFELYKELVGKLNERGVKFLAGTDYPNPYCFPGFSLHDELELLVDAGLSEIEALKSATINPALFIGKEDKIGNVASGQLANLILLDANPLENIRNTREIHTVILRGKVFEKSILKDMLEMAKINASKIAFSEWLPGSIARNGIDVAIDSLNLLIDSDDQNYLLDEYDLNSIALYFLSAGRNEMAERILENNTKVFPGSFNAYDSYAEALVTSGKYQEAIGNYKKSLEINPDNESAARKLDSLLHITN